MSQLSPDQLLSLLPHFSVILVTGNNAQTFLQGQLTCDMTPLNQHGDYSFAACCDHKGRMIANFWVIKWHENFGLILPTSMKTILSAHLQKYAPFSKVSILTEFNEIQVIAAWHYSHEQLQKIVDPIEPIITLPNPQRHLILCTHPSGLSSEANTHPSGWVSADDAVSCTHPSGWVSADDEEHRWRRNNITDKLCILSPETSLVFIPQMIGLEKQGGVSFTKGCYVGQEIIARTQHLGTLKRHCHHIQYEAAECPKPGDDFLSSTGAVIGTVVDAVMHAPGKVDALAVIQDHAF